MSGGSLIFQKPVSLLNGGTGLSVVANLGFDSFMRVNNGDTTITLAQVDPNYANSTPTYTNITTTTINNFIVPLTGTYTPTYANVANVASFGTVSDFTYGRFGNIVIGGGRVSIDPTSAAVNTEFTVTLPIASNFSLFTDAWGSCICMAAASLSAGIRAETTADKLTVKYINTAELGAQDFAISFGYRLI